MSDFLKFLYASYIKPYLDTQPKDDGDLSRHSLYQTSHTKDEQQDVEAVVAFAAAHAFLLGLRTGSGLAAEEHRAP